MFCVKRARVKKRNKGGGIESEGFRVGDAGIFAYYVIFFLPPVCARSPRVHILLLNQASAL